MDLHPDEEPEYPLSPTELLDTDYTHRPPSDHLWEGSIREFESEVKSGIRIIDTSCSTETIPLIS